MLKNNVETIFPSYIYIYICIYMRTEESVLLPMRTAKTQISLRNTVLIDLF